MFHRSLVELLDITLHVPAIDYSLDIFKLLFSDWNDHILPIVTSRSIEISEVACNAVNTHLIHRRIFLFSTPCGVGSLY